jgi:hypothetical protein
MDMGYDYNRIYDETRERGCVPIIPLKKNRLAIPLSPIPHGSNEWKRLYCGRSAVEREFGRLKHHYALAMVRVRGIERVRLHADLTILTRLACALSRARANSSRTGRDSSSPAATRSRPEGRRVRHPTPLRA